MRTFCVQVAYNLVWYRCCTTISGVDVKHGCLDRHLLITAIGAHTIRMIPPLMITEADCDRAVEIIRESVQTLGE